MDQRREADRFEHVDIPIAIIGMACRLPGANGLDQYWHLVSTGGSAVAELPLERLDQELYYDPRKGQRNKTYSRLGAILDNRQFDRQACPISPELERGVDNAHLLMCEVAAAALRHAGFDPFNVPLRNTGVYIGHAQGSNLAGDYIYGTCIEEAAQLLRNVPGFQQLPPADQEAVIREVIERVRKQTPKRSAGSPDVSTNMVAGTISKAFGLSGPFMAINSACASSLQSVMMGARALQLGRVDMAIVGGASDCKSDSLVLFSYAQSMSETGTRPFDADADGLICGEGYVALVLKTLSRALADGDPIQAIVRGAGMSCDGKGKSLWAPRKEGQVKAMERAYRGGLDMSTLQYIEAHATSTNLGDATELNALGEILSSKFPAGKKIPITSVKANIGHALEAAGISGVIKTILCMQHQTFAPAINIQSLNPKIDWEKAPFYIPQQAAPWPEQSDASLPRRAAVNAFGIGGLNVHLVLEEFTETKRATLAAQYPLSPAKPKIQQSAAGSGDANEEEAVAVIGIGCIFPSAPNPAGFWDLVTSGRDPKGHTPENRWRADLGFAAGETRPYRTPATLGGYITDFVYDWRKHKLIPKQVAQADPLQFMLLEAADQALADSGYDTKPFDRTRLGVLVGTNFGGDFATQLTLGLRLPPLVNYIQEQLGRRGVTVEQAAAITTHFSNALLERWPALVDESGSFSTSTLASRITKTMNVMGGAAAIDASDSSGAAALATAVDSLLSGDSDMMICASGQRCMNLPQYEGMAVAGVLATNDKPASPFDASAHGVVPGEGVGVVLLKRLSDARRDGDRIHTIIRGIAGAHSGSIQESLATAINRAIHDAKVAPADVAMVEMDGTGLPQADREQLQAVLSTYGQAKRQEPLVIGSVTGQIGHTLGASAMASLIKASLEIENGSVPATFGLKQPLDLVSQNSGALRAATSAEPLRVTTADGRRLGAVSSFGKGLSYHIVLERGEKVPVAHAPASPTVTSLPREVPKPVTQVQPVLAAAAASELRIWRLGAATPAALAAKVQQALGNPAAWASGLAVFTPADRVRLAIVAGDAATLERKLQLAVKQLANPEAAAVLEQQGCFYRQMGEVRPRIAFLFSGQGSQYGGMLRELVRDVPASAAALRELDAVLVRRGYPTFAQMAWEQPEQLGADIWVTQIAMLAADTIVHAALADLGIRPDLVAGHSFGEFAALTAAGVWDLEGAVTATRARYEAIAATSTARGTLMATSAPSQLIGQLAVTLSERAYAANYNAPDQTVVGGRPESLKQLQDLLSVYGHKSQMLSVPCPFHTPLMQGTGELLGRALTALRMHPPRVPLLSSVTNRYVADPADIRENLAAQLTTPVRYVELITRIADEQDTVFIEVGPQQALTKLHRRILENRQVAGIIAADNSKRPGCEQLLGVRALLECLDVYDSAPQTPTRSVVAATSAPAKPVKGTITHFDATQRRIEKMRRAAAKGQVPPRSESPAPAAVKPTAPPRVTNGTPAAGRNGSSTNGEHAPPVRPAQPDARPIAARVIPQPAAVSSAPPAKPTPAPAAQAPPAPTPTAAANAPTPAASSSLKAAELEKFLINFVVEQTGYPPEIVELDADMEADLGIDSIKKAQLFGEMAEYFDVQANENLTLDDFPTLRHVMNFLAGAQVKGTLPATSAEPAASAPSEALASPAPAPAPQPVVAAASTPAVTSAPAAPAQNATGSFDPAELEKFLINFVVEQTGYPPEIVELDADMEADLGIDSIKKAQLFGEMAEYFDVQANENLTLDDFPTLRHVMNFLAGAQVKGTLPATSAEPAASAPREAPAFHAPAPGPVAAASTPATTLIPALTSAPAAVAPTQNASGSFDSAELEKFLINFVVEQTGYPPEIVELDADMEADLGIDSIKKAQLFGEMAEYFDVQANENLTLDDFPTLRHVMNFLAGAQAKGTLPTNGALPEDMPPTNGAAYTNGTPSFAAPSAPEPVVVAHQAPAPTVEVRPADFAAQPATFAPQPTTSEPTPHISAVAHDGGLAVQSRLAPTSLDPAELEKFLINFVVEQTGYPPEIVELDADMEADLGIDSIKKAQLFGEMAEYFDVQANENLTLDDFPTLRHVMSFLVGSELKKNLTPQPVEDLQPPAQVESNEQQLDADPLEPIDAPPPQLSVEEQPRVNPVQAGTRRIDTLRVIRVGGTPYEIGLAHGQQLAEEIRRILRRLVDVAGPEWDDLTAANDKFTAAELEELRGIADGAGVPLPTILAMNLTIYSDLGTARQHGVFAATSGHLLHAASYELPLLGAVAECVAPVVQVRVPMSGVPHLLLSVAGTVGGLAGVNAQRVALTASAANTAGGREHVAIGGNLLASAASLAAAVAALQSRNSSSWNAGLSQVGSPVTYRLHSDGRNVQIGEGVVSPGEAMQKIANHLSSKHAPPYDAQHAIHFAIDHAHGILWAAAPAPLERGLSIECRLSIDELLPPANPVELAPSPAPAVPQSSVAPAYVADSAATKATQPDTQPYDLNDGDGSPTARFVLKIVDSPFDEAAAAMPTWHGAALIVGSNPLADALTELLTRSGVSVRHIPQADDLDATLLAFEQIWREQPTPHLFIVSPRTGDVGDPFDATAWQRRWTRDAVVPYFLCQRFVQLAGEAGLLDQCSFVFTTALNGDFGFDSHSLAPEGGALTGLAKAIYIEFAILRNLKNLRTKAIDAPNDESAQALAANICRELGSGEVDYEVAFVNGTRRVQYALPRKAPVAEYADIRPGGVWVLTGGGRGITAECAMELGRRYRLKLHLIGTLPAAKIDPSWRNLSAEGMKALRAEVMKRARAAGKSMDGEWSRVRKEIEVDRSLRTFAAAGVDATYHACDVTDATALGELLDSIRSTSGPIEGILHGAGIERSGSYERKAKESVLETFSVKIAGALNLMRLTRRDPIRHFIGFGSVSGRLGSNGQTDYCVANDALCKLMGWYRHQRPGVKAIGFHWHPWDEVGMAARPESVAMLKMTDAPALMAKREGLDHFVRELHAGVPASEVLITTWEYHGRFYGTQDHPSFDTTSPFTSTPPWVSKAWPALPFQPLASRHELHMVDAPLASDAPAEPHWQGSACILGDNPTARALAARLQAAGVVTHLLNVAAGSESLLPEISAIYAEQPPTYWFLMTGRDEDARSSIDRDVWQTRRARGLVTPYQATEHLFRLRMKAKDSSSLTVVAATALGGDFGLAGNLALPDGGALCGLVKSLHVEEARKSTGLRAKVIDAPADEAADAVVTAIVRELAASEPDVEVGWAKGQRRVVRSHERPVETLSKLAIPRGSTWVMTGGARGITAAVAFEMGQRYGLKLHLIGRSPVPRSDAPWRTGTPEQRDEIKAQVVRDAVAAGRSPHEDWQRIKCDIEIHDTLAKLAAAGIQATYHCCDLGDYDKLAVVLDEVRRADGPIEGVLHGAGYAKPGRFGTRNAKLLERTIAGKLDGAAALMALTERDPVRYFIGFGSIGGRYGANGLSDYAAANDMLSKLFDWYATRRTGCRVACFHWQSWDEIGMVTLEDGAVSTKKIMKMAFISPREGVEHLCRELEAGLPTRQVLITDGVFERIFYPFVFADADATVTATPAASHFPLVARTQAGEEGSTIAEIDFDPTADPFLLDHQFRGKPLLPAVIGMESMAESAALHSGKHVAAIRNVQLVDRLLFHTERPITARVRVTPADASTVNCELTSDFRNRADKLLKRDQPRIRANIELADARPTLDLPMAQPPESWRAFVFENNGPLYHGPAFQGVRALALETGGGWGQLVALPFAQLSGGRTSREWIVPASLLDACFYVCGIYTWLSADEAFSLPLSVDLVRLGRAPRDNEACLVHFACRKVDPPHAIYDFTVFGDDREPILHVEGHRVVTIKS